VAKQETVLSSHNTHPHESKRTMPNRRSRANYELQKAVASNNIRGVRKAISDGANLNVVSRQMLSGGFSRRRRCLLPLPLIEFYIASCGSLFPKHETKPAPSGLTTLLTHQPNPRAIWR